MRILAIITTDKNKVGEGGSPIFYAQDKEELIEIAQLLSGILTASIHDLHNDVFVIVKH